MKPTRDLGDIILRLRRRAAEMRGCMPSLAAEFRETADEIELAELFGLTDRPTGPWNSLAVRQALKALVECLEGEAAGNVDAKRRTALLEAARKALEAPPRNCDVYGLPDYARAQKAFLAACGWEGETGCEGCRYQSYDCWQAWLMDLAWPGAEEEGDEDGESDETKGAET